MKKLGIGDKRVYIMSEEEHTKLIKALDRIDVDCRCVKDSTVFMKCCGDSDNKTYSAFIEDNMEDAKKYIKVINGIV